MSSPQLQSGGRLVVLMSGGVDSMVCSHLLRQQGHSVEAVFVDYGQPARELEFKAATSLAIHFGIPIFQLQCTGWKVPEEGEILGRNLFLVSAAMMHLRTASGMIALGIHTHTHYYDCSTSFVRDCQGMLNGYSGGQLRLLAPLQSWTKADIFAYCRMHHLPLFLTYSCERGAVPPCGHCLSCKDREILNGLDRSHIVTKA